MKRFLLAYLPAALWAAFVFFVGGQSDLGTPNLRPPIDKAAHFGMYGILGGLTGWGWIRAGRRPGIGWPILLVLVLAAADEFHQSIVPERASEMADWVADCAGALLAYGLLVVRSIRLRTEERVDDA